MADRKTVMSWLDGLTQDDWQSFHSDSEVQQIAIAAFELLKEQDETIKELQNAYGYLQNQFFEAQDKLLKEQEAVKPKSKVRHGVNAQIQHFCGNCNTMLHGKPKFCSECGKGVLW